MRKVFASLVLGLMAWGSLTTLSLAADKPKPDPEAQFKKMDANSDGKLTVEEFVGKRTGEAADKAKAQFAKVDKNSDGGVSLDEFKSRGKKAK